MNSALLKLLAYFIFSFSLAASADQALTRTACDVASPDLHKRQVAISKKLVTINSLIEASDQFEVPLSVLFQVNLEDDKAIEARIKELQQFTSIEAVLRLPEFQELRACGDATDVGRKLMDLAEGVVELNKKKLVFFTLPKDRREAITSIFEVHTDKLESQIAMESQLSESKASLDEAQTNLIKSETKVLDGGGPPRESLTTARAFLDQYIVDIESEHIAFIEGLMKKRSKLEGLRTSLSNLTRTQDEEAAAALSEKLDAVNGIWYLAAEELLDLFSSSDIGTSFKAPSFYEVSGDPTDAYVEYKTSYQKAKARREELSTLKHSLLIELKAQNFRLLNDAGYLRALLIRKCETHGPCDGIDGLSEKYLRSLAREVQILPLKFLAGGINKWVEFKVKLDAGLDSWIDLGRQLSILIFLILLPFFAHRLFSWLSRRLDLFRSAVLSRAMLDFRRGTSLAMWISRLNPFLPSVGMIASVHLARALLETTDLREISYLLFYLELYFIYRASRIIFRILLEYLFSTNSIDHRNETGERAELTARRLSRFFFIQYALLNLIEDTVRRALVYELVDTGVVVMSLVIFIVEVRNWREEIVRAFRSRYTHFWPQVSNILEGRLGSLALPFLLMAVIAHQLTLLVSRQLINFDFFKRLLSDIFRRRIEKTESESLRTAPGPEYLTFFDYYRPAREDVFVDRDPTVAQGALQGVRNWLEGSSSDDLILLIGTRGLGKTTTLKTIFERIEGVQKSYNWMPAKILTEAALYDWLSGVLDVPIRSPEDFIELDGRTTEKRVLLIDDIQNMFLGQIGGFEAYRAFIEIIGLRTKNFFWCLTVNAQSWTYLRGVFGADHFYGKTLRMRKWSDAEIQKLILTRHDRAGYHRTFDESITAYGTGNMLGEKTETQFFRLLWGQSRGNPRSALMHWISSVSETEPKHLHVGVPKFIESTIVGALSGEALVQLAAIARHDSLTLPELISVTGVEKVIVRKCMKEAHDKDLVWSDDHGRIRISSRAQSAIDYYLIGKNYLYE